MSQNSVCLLSYEFRSLKSRVKILVDGTLLIPNLIPEDAGNYTCIPTNGLLTPPSASAYLTVKRKALIYASIHTLIMLIPMFGRSFQLLKNNHFLFLFPQTPLVWVECPGRHIYPQGWRELSSALSRPTPLHSMLTGPKMEMI